MTPLFARGARRVVDDCREAWLARIPLRLLGRPEDLVGVVVLLASDEARLITGATFTVEGGVTAG